MNRTPFEKVGDFLLGRGFYIVLFLCVATIGFSGYYLISSFTPNLTGDTISPTSAAPEVIIPDPVIVEPTPAVDNSPIIIIDDEEEEAVVEEIPTPSTTVVQVDTLVIPVSTTPAVYTWPVKGEILREFSVDVLSEDITMGDWRTHDGVDIMSPLGTSVLSPSDGVVLSVEEDDLMGTTVVIEHTDGVTSTLSNLSPVAVVQAGDSVSTGTVIGAVGESALSESAMEPHLHLSMTLDGQSIDPLDKLP